MNTQTIINQCLEQGVRLSVENGNLQIDAPKGGLSNEMITILRENKAQLIEFINKFSAQKSAVEKQKLKRAVIDGPIPLSFAQQRLWIIDRIEQGSAQYNMSAAFKLDGSLNQAAFIATIDAVIERHEILRTVYKETNDKCEQVIRDQVDSAVTIIDFTHLQGDDLYDEIRSLAEQDALKPFDLQNDTMLRVQLIKASGSEHYVLFNMHHIASDGWSLGVLVKEFLEVYTAYSQGQPNPLVELEVQYKDYAHWQRQWLQGEVFENEVGYWREQLKGLPATHSLPLDRSRPAQQGFLGNSLRCELSVALTKKLDAYCQQQGVTQFMALQTIYALLVGQWSAEEDVVMGTPVAGRIHQNVEPLIGFFLNNLVLRTDLSGNPSFNELIASNRTTLLEAFEHQHLPFDALVEDLNPERSSSHQPMFQLWFVLQNHDSGTFQLPGLEMSDPEEILSGVDVVNFDISLSAAVEEGKLVLVWQYKSDLFDAHTMENFAQSFEALLANAIANGDEKISTISGVTEGTLQPWQNANEHTFENKTNLIKSIFEFAQQNPDAIALRVEDEAISYGELAAKVSEFSQQLTALGVVTESPVGICVDRSIEQLIAQLAVMHAGGAYVPLDAGAPNDRIEYIIADTGLHIVVAQSHYNDKFKDINCQTLTIDHTQLVATGEINVDDINLSAEQLAYVLYTSGSTGKPKGVAVQHGNLVNLANSMKLLLSERGVSGQYRWAWNAPMIFDASVQALTQLAFGVELNLLKDELRKDPSKLLSYLTENKIDVLDTTPALVDLVLREANEQGIALPNLLIGGEAISSELWQKVASHASEHQRFALNVYGPTECTVNATFSDITAESVPNIGRPLPNCQTYILNDALAPLAAGAKGEIYIGGEGVARGYFNNDVLTEERFIESATFGRIYKTGDLGRWLADGTIEYLGRSDFQVKLRGYRIELNEIESVILEDAGVTDAAVLVKDEQLVAYVAGADVNQNRLSDWMKAKLPAYMVAAVIIEVEEIPLTKNGKQDRKALLSIELEEVIDDYIAPRSEMEARLQTIWQDLLGKESISMDDNFFAIGGHSLLGIRVASACREQLSIEIPLKVLMENPTIQALAEQCELYEKQKLVMSSSVARDDDERMVI
ncbi:non-ribosomal peptide synthetase [Pseudoalteromonas piscicida]|uniref:non-ribosomal peptide synthetase n=1 Tax=Pseudoalteromonas piscicida TaxID=43662 RepID=UPI0027E4A518|nr:amino acid adenylation domain-containing protein [Pseudoalteromonas piscicida]WMO15325.1 amino acid adenylation domain-containing protein [Pseudoalteromonas piscicida]